MKNIKHMQKELGITELLNEEEMLGEPEEEIVFSDEEMEVIEDEKQQDQRTN